jgi:hypothetical protein
MNREEAHATATPMNDAGISQGSTTNSMISSNSINNVDWAGTHVQFYQAEEMRDWILLDNESTASIFCNTNYQQDIQESSEELVLSTNGGGLKTKLTATVVGYPKQVWYNPRAITNIFAFHEMERFYRITYDSEKKKAFIVHMEKGKKNEFKQARNGLYYYKPKESFNTQTANVKETNLMNMVEENKKFFTNRQISRAYKARDIGISLTFIRD